MFYFVFFLSDFDFIHLSTKQNVFANACAVCTVYNWQVFPTKAPKLSANPAALARQDTIDETVEGEHSPMAVRERGHLQRSSVERQSTERDPLERSASHDRESTSGIYDSGVRETASSLAQRDLISSVMDMKVDMRLEMQRMAQRIGRMEDLLSELIKRTAVQVTSVHSSPDDVIPVITTTVVSTTPPGSSTPAEMEPLLPQTPQTLPIPPPMIIVPSNSSTSIVTTSAVVTPQPSSTSTLSTTSASSSGTGLGPILLRKRRSKTRKAPPPPVSSPEQTRLLDAEMPAPGTSSRKRDFL